MEIEEWIQTLQPTSAGPSAEALKQQLAQKVAYLVEHDFERLVRVLYTVDVDERVLKHFLLQQPHRPAADIIAELLIERQLQKAEFRQQTKTDTTATDDERW